MNEKEQIRKGKLGEPSPWILDIRPVSQDNIPIKNNLQMHV